MSCPRIIRSTQKCTHTINLTTHLKGSSASLSGWITFVSKLYPGRISDKEIVEKSNFCQLCSRERVLMICKINHI